MNRKNIAVALSESSSDTEAIKEAVRKIKALIPDKSIAFAILFFTPHYKPTVLKETIAITLSPYYLYGVQSPTLIFQDKFIAKGIILCCFAAGGLKVKSFLLKNNDPERIESIFRRSVPPSHRKNKWILSTVAPSMRTSSYVKSLQLALSRSSNFFGIGFLKKYGMQNFQIRNEMVDAGINTAILDGGFSVDHHIISGFFPLGKSFVITRVIPEKNIIVEINGKPAVHIYEKYLEDKFEAFKRSALGGLYPIGVKENSHYRILSIVDILEDGSLFYTGTVKEGERARIMMATPASLLDDAKRGATVIKLKPHHSLALILNSCVRKKILRRDTPQEISLIKRILGEKTDIVGLYADYYIFPRDGRYNFSIENNNLCVILLDYGNS